MYSFLLTIIIIIIDGSFEYFRGLSLFGVEAGHSRLFSLFIDEPIVGTYISSSSMLFISIYIFRYGLQTIKRNIFLISIFFFTTLFTFMSGERVALGSILLFGLFFLIFSNKRIYEKLLIFLMLFTIIFILIFTNDRSMSRFQETINDLTSREYFFIAASSVHETHYKSSILIFKDHPILGIGSNLYRDNCNKKKYFVSDKSCTTHPHSYYFQVLAENGLVGFVIFCLIFVYILYRLATYSLVNFNIIKAKHLISENFLPFYFFLATKFCPFWPSGSLYNNWSNVFIFLGVGFLLIPIVNNSKGKRIVTG